MTELVQYRFLATSFGGFKPQAADTNIDWALSEGIRVKYFTDQFTNKLSPRLAFIQNIDAGPAIAYDFSQNRLTYWLTVNYVFGGSAATPKPEMMMSAAH